MKSYIQYNKVLSPADVWDIAVEDSRFRQIFDKFLSFFLPFFLLTHQTIFPTLKNLIYKSLILSCRPKRACCRLGRQPPATLRQAHDSVDSLPRPCSKPAIRSTASRDPAASPRPKILPTTTTINPKTPTLTKKTTIHLANA